MALPPKPDCDEVQRLKRCINDLVSVLAMPAIWSGGEPSRIARTLPDALTGMLRLDFVYVRLKDSSGPPIELIRLAQSGESTAPPPETARALGRLSEDDPRTWPASIRNPAGDGDIAILPLQLGLQGDIGLLVAGSCREDFPQQTERLVLGVAANQATIALQEARRLREQKRLADDVDHRVARRTAELAAVNEELKQEIAERLRAETALRDSERNSRLIVDSVPGLVSVLTPSGEVEFVNRQILEYFGRTLEKLKGWATSDAVHPEDLPRAVEAFTRSIASGHPFEFEIRARRFDGVYRWFQSRGFPLRDTNGHVVRWYNLLIDIHESKRVEEALRQSEAQRAEAERDLQLTIDNIPTLVTAYRPDGSRIFVNRIWLDYSGLSRDQALQEKRWSMVHPDDVERATEEWRIARATETEFKSELRLRRADGEYRWHVLHRVPARNKAGEIVKWYGAAVDVEDRKRAEEARRKSEAQLTEAQRELQLTIDSIPAMVATYEPDGARRFVNQQWRSYVNLTLEEATGAGRRITRHFHPDDSERADRAWRNALATGEPLSFDLRIRRADGEYRWHTHHSVPLRDEQGTVVKWYAAEVDIEDKKRAESALRRSETRLVEAERELRLTLESIPTITWRGGPNGYVQQLNKRWFEYTGTTPEQIRGRRWQSCVHPHDLERLLDIGRAYVATGTPIDCEARLRRFDGTYRWFLFRPAAARDETGKIIGWYGIITDIEDRKRAEEKAVEAERELQRMIDNIPVLIGTYSADGARLSVNKRALEVTGLSTEDVTDERWKKAFHPDDIEPIERQWRACLASGEPFEREIRTLTADGTYRWHLTRRVPVRDSAGKLIRWYGIAHDIEDQKRAEDVLRTREVDLRKIIDTIPALAWSARLDGSAEFCNQNYIAYTGLSLEQLQDWGYAAAVHPDDVATLGHTWQTILDSGQPGEAEARLRRHDGEYRWFLFRTNPLRDEWGNIIKWYGTNVDIEDRKRADEALRRSEAFLARGQELSLTGSFSWHSGTGEFTWSEQLYRIYEFQPGTRITFELIRTRYHPEDKHVIQGVAEQARAGVADFDYGHRLLMPDGSIKYVHLVAHGSPDREGNGLEYFGAVQDVTQRRLAEEARDKAQSELAHVARVTSLGVLTASIAHEVNQPLAAIITNSETSLRRLARPDPDIERIRDIAARVVADARRAAEIIDRIRAMATRRPPKQTTLSLDDLIEESIVFLRHEFQSRGVSVTVDLAPELPPVVGDRTQLQQVIVNLTINAAQAMAESAAVKRSILIRTMSDTATVSCSIEDSGPGIDPTYLPRVFDSFFTTKDSGMGMGLPICRSIIESHEGQIRVDNNSTLGGARFSFALPANGHTPS